MKYSKTIQIIILIAILALLTVFSIDLILLYQLTDLIGIKALFSFIVPYIISSIFKELNKSGKIKPPKFLRRNKKKPAPIIKPINTKDLDYE